MTGLGAMRFDEVLERLGAPAPSPAGASAAALAASMAASLVVMTARGTPDWAEGASVAERAAELRGRLVELAEEDASAVGRLLELFRGDPSVEDQAVGLVDAATPPVAIAEAAAEVVELARAAAEGGKPVMRADASAGALLAEAAVRTAALVVETDLGAVPGVAGAAERAELSARAGAALARI